MSAEMEPRTSFCLDITPFDVQIVFRNIMEYVASDHQSALQCRRVSHAWNNMAVEVLHQSSSVLQIGRTPKNSGLKYDDGDGETNKALEKMTDPCNNLRSAINHLNLEFDVKSTSQISGRIHPPPPPILHVLDSVNRGSNMIITSISYNISPADGVQVNFKNLVRACASTLKQLTFIRGGPECSARMSTTWEANPFSEFDQNEFPNLTSITVHMNDITATSDLGFNALPLLIANSSPKLSTIRYPSGNNFSMHLQIRHLLSTETRSLIQELEIPSLRWASLTPDFLHGFRFPQLRKLILNLDLNHFDTETAVEQFSMFFKDCLPLLQELELNWINACLSTGLLFYFFNPVIRTFPSLPSLVHFGLASLRAIPAGHNIMTDVLLRRIASQCTGIKSFSIGNRSFCDLLFRKYPNEIGQLVPTGIVFPNVECLFLSGPFFAKMVDEDIHKVPILVSQMFPTLNKISIDFGPKMYDSQLDIIQQFLLTGFLKVNGLRQLEMMTYYRNWFGKTYLGIQTSNLAKDLEHLVLNLPKNLSPDYKPELIQVPDIEHVINGFPKLKVLQINPLLLRTSKGGSGFHEILNEVLNLRCKFVNVDLRIC